MHELAQFVGVVVSTVTTPLVRSCHLDDFLLHSNAPVACLKSIHALTFTAFQRERSGGSKAVEGEPFEDADGT